MRRKTGAFLESTTEVEARQAGVRSERRKRDVGIAVRTQAFDRASQSLGSQPAYDRLDGGRLADVRGQDARGDDIGQSLPEECIQNRVALQHIRPTHQQSGCDRVEMPGSLQKITWNGRVGFAGD